MLDISSGFARLSEVPTYSNDRYRVPSFSDLSRFVATTVQSLCIPPAPGAAAPPPSGNNVNVVGGGGARPQPPSRPGTN